MPEYVIYDDIMLGATSAHWATMSNPWRGIGLHSPVIVEDRSLCEFYSYLPNHSFALIDMYPVAVVGK